MHIEAKNENFACGLMGSALSVTDQERELKVMVDSSMNVSTQPFSKSKLNKKKKPIYSK